MQHRFLSYSFQPGDFGLASPHNYVSQFLEIDMQRETFHGTNLHDHTHKDCVYFLI